MTDPELQATRLEPNVPMGHPEEYPDKVGLDGTSSGLKEQLQSFGIPGLVGLTEEEQQIFLDELRNAQESTENNGNGAEIKKNPDLTRREAFRNSYARTLGKIPIDQLTDRVLQRHREDDNISGVVRLFDALSNFDQLFANHSPEEKTKPLLNTRKVDLSSIIPQSGLDKEQDGAIRKSVKFFEERGENDNKYIFEQYFVAQVPAVTIARDLDLDEHSVTQIIKGLYRRLGEEEVVDPDTLLKKEFRAPYSCPQDKVIKWVSWSEDRQLPVSNTDISFALRELPKWGLQKLDINGEITNIFKTNVKEYESKGLVEMLSAIIPDLDENTTLDNDGEKIHLTVNGDLEPYHLIMLAVVDFILENDSFKAMQNIRIELGEMDQSSYSSEYFSNLDIAEEKIHEIFSDRELDVLSRINRPYSVIASELDISTSSVRTHICRMMEKTGLHPEILTLISYELGVIDFDEATEKSVNGHAEPLSYREYEAVSLLSEGLQYTEIASRLNVSISTIRTHLHNAYLKLGADGSRTAVLTAYANDEIALPQKAKEFIDTLVATDED